MKIKTNKKGLFDYEVLKKYEAGIVLEGWEVKSIKTGNFSMEGSYVYASDSGIWIKGLGVSNWQYAKEQPEEHRRRDRRLLLTKDEVKKIRSFLKENKRVSIIPVDFFIAHNLIKVTIGLVKGKRQYEKKEKIKNRDIERDMKREISKY